jgi:pimeloyl-ACP methyl ester carboxylesterase
MKARGLVALGAFAALYACSNEAAKDNPIGAAAGASGVAAGPGAGAGGGGGATVGGSAGIGTVPVGGTTPGTGGVGTGGTGGSPAGGTAGEMAGAPATGGGSGGAGGATSGTTGTDPLPPLPPDQALPIVFVHGYAGSAQQYQSQAMRFVANGYPPERIVAYEHDGAGIGVAGFVAGLGQVVDAALAEFGTSQVFLVGHSRGTSVSSSYLGNAQQAAKVAKYIAIDGSPCPGGGVPCITPNQAMFSGQRHVEVCTSKESFAMQYEFLLGTAPQVVDIVRQRAPVEISGRAVNFPANTGRDGTTVKIFPIDAATGARTQADPIATFTIGADGNWGPTVIDPDSHYEMELSASSGVTTHFYMQRILRSTKFVRLLSGPPDSPTRMNTHTSAAHTTVVVSRQREWLASDVLEIATTSPSGGDRPAVNAMMLPGVGAAMAIGIHIHDAAASPGDSTLNPLPYFSGQPFQYGVDVFMPAANPPDGTITLRNVPRGDTNAPQVLNVPNWASSQHHVSVMFSDFPLP